ncbi:hypothetical protein LRP88_09250 [Fusarium phalaenopsidis]
MGQIPNGTGRKRNNMGTIAAGVNPQGPVEYADIDGDGKADYLVVWRGGAVNAYISSYHWLDVDLEDDSGPGSGGNDGGGSGGGDDENDEDDDYEKAPPYDPVSDDDQRLDPCPFTPESCEQIEALDYNNELKPHCVPVANVEVRCNEIIDDGYFEVYADYVVDESGFGS